MSTREAINGHITAVTEAKVQEVQMVGVAHRSCPEDTKRRRLHGRWHCHLALQAGGARLRRLLLQGRLKLRHACWRL